MTKRTTPIGSLPVGLVCMLVSLPQLAQLYHDAIYVAGQTSNESASAALARSTLTDLDAIDVREAVHLILLTAAHGKLTPVEVDRDAALVLDCDMAILGASSHEYLVYERGIAAQYGHVSRVLFATGRRRFIERLLGMERIRLSDDFLERMDPRARMNLRDDSGRFEHA